MTQQSIIIDIDGTLSNPNHRRNLVEGEDKDWERFFRKAQFDGLNEWCKEIIDKFKNTHDILLVTGRPEKTKDEIPLKALTEDWLWRKEVDYDKLVMRPEGDFREDTDLKEDLLHKELPDPENILFAVDDREDIAEMWRENGITCLQCKDKVEDK